MFLRVRRRVRSAFCRWSVHELAAAQQKVNLPEPPAVDAEIDLNLADGAYFLSARLNVSVPGVDREVARKVVDAAHGICPYSKALHGNIEVATTVV
jgi:organic hydroperoxide reductase OsmC/OhrA